MSRLISDLEESSRIALEQLRAHKVRSLLTALGVIIGVWAVILIGVGINGLDTGFQRSMDLLGPNLLYVEKWPWKDVGDDWFKYRNRPDMDTDYSKELNEIIAATPNSKLVLAVPTLISNRSISAENRTISNITIEGSNADYSYALHAELNHGRFFTTAESSSGQNVVILGSEVTDALFPDEEGESVVGKTVRIARIKFTVIGTLEEQGKFLGLHSADDRVIMPLPTLRKFFVGHRRWDSTRIIVVKRDGVTMQDARDEAIGAMRRIRGLLPGEVDDFEVNASDLVENTLGPIKRNIAVAGFLITGLALFVGAIGIMNITFVSVKERTKEIGTRRAIGARRSSILIQFLIEAVSICVLGGICGLLAAFFCKLGIDFYFPTFPGSFSFTLMAVAVALSVSTGILSGFVPAWMASRLDPATALRYE